MRRRLRAWAHGVRRERENVIIASLPPRERWRIYLAVGILAPRQLARHARLRFRRWAALPGDRWECASRAQRGVVARIDRRGVLLDVANAEDLDRAPDWPDALPEGALRSYLYADEHWIPE